MNPVRTKADYYRRWLAGEFGNRPQAWDSWASVLASDYRGPLVVRRRKAGTSVKYKLPFHEVVEYIKGREADFAFNEPMPDDKLIVQGELERYPFNLSLSYCTEKITMRTAMSQCKVATGLVAERMLRHWGQGSEEWLFELLDLYPGHVIEFGIYSTAFGTLNQKLCVWEVRAY